MKLSKDIKVSETEKNKVFNLGRIFNRDAFKKPKHEPKYGKTMFLCQSKKKPNQLRYFISHFQIFGGKAKTIPDTGVYYTFLVKNGALQVYRVSKNENFKVRNINAKIRSKLELPSKITTVHYVRFLKVLRAFLKENNYPYLPKCNIKEDYDFYRQMSLCLFPGLKIFDKDIRFDGEEQTIFRKPISFKESIKKATGFKGKKITKLFAENLQPISSQRIKRGLSVYNLKHLKGLVPLDIFHECLESGAAPMFSKEEVNFLKLFSQETRNALIRDRISFKAKSSDVKDTINAWKMLKGLNNNFIIPNNIRRTWDELHDYLYQEQLKITNPPEPLEYDEKTLLVDNAEIDDIRIELPKDTYKLIEYGQKLSHCVGTYGYLVKQKFCTIFGVYKQNQLKYCLEIRQKKVTQFRGKFNDRNETKEDGLVRLADELKVKEFLTQKELLER